MKKNITTVILALVFGSSVMLADEADKKTEKTEKTLTGKVACAKCTEHDATKSKRCRAAFVFINKNGEKEVLLVEGKGDTPIKKHHWLRRIIPPRLFVGRGTYLEVTLTGVRESLGADTITASKIELLKK
tara:strand:+ start:1862 stop:2251 length:390 start_codon:yes stop_codon:yes gene_type:complete